MEKQFLQGHFNLKLPILRKWCAILISCGVLGVVSVGVTSSSAVESAATPQEIQTKLTDKGKNLSALKAVMNITSSYDQGKSRQDVKGFLLYRRPSDFRFQGVAPGGNSLFELIIKSQFFELYIPSEGKIIKGNKDCFSRKFPDVAEIESLIPLVLLQWKDVRPDKLLSRDNQKIVMRMSFRGKVWAATLEPQTLHLKRLVRLNPSGEIDLTADFSEFKAGAEGWLPTRFDVQSAQAGWKTLVRIGQLEPNPFLVEKNFKLETAFSPRIEDCK
jgi:outer membrane lipoprotein-sorting protein